MIFTAFVGSYFELLQEFREFCRLMRLSFELLFKKLSFSAVVAEVGLSVLLQTDLLALAKIKV